MGCIKRLSKMSKFSLHHGRQSMQRAASGHSPASRPISCKWTSPLLPEQSVASGHSSSPLAMSCKWTFPPVPSNQLQMDMTIPVSAR
jgi:hypothetical protein